MDVLAAELRGVIDRHESGEARRDLNPIASPFQEYREVFDHAPKVNDQDWSNIATRLETLDRALSGYLAGLQLGRTRGETVAARQIVEVVRQARIVESSSSPFLALCESYGEGDVADRLETAVGAGRAAFGAFADRLEREYLPHAPQGDRVGEDRYRRAAYHHLGTHIDLREAYDWGWQEIAAISARIQAVAAEIAPGGSMADAMVALKTDPQRAASSQAEFVDFAQTRIDEARERLNGLHFDVPASIITCRVQMAPPGGSLGAYYVPPSEDFTRPGTVWWSMGDDDEPIPLYSEVSTAYHEGLPGHHLQSGIQLTVADKLTRLHRLLVWKSGSGEGWALYAERLMDENGFLDTPDYVFGYLTAQMHRACRVVIDIGSHLDLTLPSDQAFHPGERWTYDRGVEMLETYATLDTANARSEMNRFLGWPGQAISYKIGEREIIRLRDEMRRREGPRFAAKEFHASVLEVGAIDIDLTNKYVRG